MLFTFVSSGDWLEGVAVEGEGEGESRESGACVVGEEDVSWGEFLALMFVGEVIFGQKESAFFLSEPSLFLS